MVEIDYGYEVLRFSIGLVGTLAFFMVIKFKFIRAPHEIKENTDAIMKNWPVCTFFCVLGGLFPWMLDVRSPYGWFAQGFMIRATFELLTPKEWKEKGAEDLERIGYRTADIYSNRGYMLRGLDR